MKQEIRQNGKTVLYSGDGHSIPMIFNNLVGKNLKGREYSDYIAFVAIPDMGFVAIRPDFYFYPPVATPTTPTFRTHFFFFR